MINRPVVKRGTVHTAPDSGERRGGTCEEQPGGLCGPSPCLHSRKPGLGPGRPTSHGKSQARLGLHPTVGETSASGDVILWVTSRHHEFTPGF